MTVMMPPPPTSHEETDMPSRDRKELLKEIEIMNFVTDIYPSRKEEHPQITFRQDPVLWSPEEDAASCGLSLEQARAFDRDGYLLLPDVFSQEEVDALSAELVRLASDDAVLASEDSIKERDSGALRSLFRLDVHSEILGLLARDQRLLSIAEFLLGGSVYLHQSRSNLKPGFRGLEFYWHSDFETWHVEDGMPRMRAVSMSVALTDNTPLNGPLMLVPGSHRQFIGCVGETPSNNHQSSLKRQEIGVPDEDSLRLICEQSGIAAPTGKRGSVILFDCNTMHGSGGNITPLPRNNAFFVYNSIENQLVEPFWGGPPRPGFLAARGDVEPLECAGKPDYAALAEGLLAGAR
jgi:ectoine hydroxylase